MHGSSLLFSPLKHAKQFIKFDLESLLTKFKFTQLLDCEIRRLDYRLWASVASQQADPQFRQRLNALEITIQ